MTQPIAPSDSHHWIIGTRKGAWPLSRSARGEPWTAGDPWFFGMQVHHVVQDWRGDGGTLLAAVRTGHLGPTVFRSTDGGTTWKEAAEPPRFREADSYADSGLPEDDKRREGLAVNHVFFLSPGHASEPGVWYAGTSNIGLFRSEDDGVSWSAVSGFNDNPTLKDWTWNFFDGTPDGAKCHSVQVCPTSAQRLLVGLSGGGIFLSEDRGESWRPINLGVAADFMPPKDDGSEYEYGHDPHDVVIHPARPERLYHQNHCGIYRVELETGVDPRWTRIGDNMPKDVGDIGFPMTCHPRDPDRAWVFPMDGSDVWPRVSPGGKPAVYRTSDAGATWERQDRGLPGSAWYTVLRQAMAHNGADPLGLCFATTSGDVFTSDDEGETWQEAVRAMPKAWSVSPARLS